MTSYPYNITEENEYDNYSPRKNKLANKIIENNLISK